MPKLRRYRFTEQDVDQLRQRTHGQVSFDDHSKWVERVPELDVLIHEITAAFQGTTLADGIGLFEANGIDDYALTTELAELRLRDEKHDWRKIETEQLNFCNASPAYFDARGFWFHLPAFLIAELNDDYNVGFIDILLSNLQGHREWIKLLTTPQRRVIAKTLKLLTAYPDLMHQKDEIDIAIQRLEKLQCE